MIELATWGCALALLALAPAALALYRVRALRAADRRAQPG
jgi:hypothetical protein